LCYKVQSEGVSECRPDNFRKLESRQQFGAKIGPKKWQFSH